MKKISERNLTSKMLCRMVKDVLTGVLIFCILNWGGIASLHSHLMDSGNLSDAEQETITAFQQYVSSHHLKMSDTPAIRSWVEQRNIREFVLSKGGPVYFDNRYQEDFFPGAIQQRGFQFLSPVNFSDGEAQLYLYNGEADKYYDIITGIAAVVSVILCLLIFGSEFQQEIKNIQYLQKKVERIGEGSLTEPVSLSGYDEICQLARGVDLMRKQSLEQKETHERMKQAQDELVLGMAHDLRTPLTGLFSYLEIIRKLEKEGKPTLEYAEKAFDKAKQLRSVSDQLFEYFLVSKESNTELEEPEKAQSAFADYLSEFCSFLQCSGMEVEAGGLVWKPVLVRMNPDFFGRIMNNLISNIEKYADKEKPVRLNLRYTPTHIELVFQNGIITPNPYVQGTGIGLKNIELMMKQMNGFSTVEMTEDTYRIRLSFPTIG